MTKKNNLQKTLSEKSPWINNHNKIWLASTVSLYRNIEKFPFPPKLDEMKRKQIISLLSKSLLGMDLIKKPAFIKTEDSAPLEKQFLAEHFLIPGGLQQYHAGEAFVIDAEGEFFTSLNIDNHIQFEYIDTKGELENSWAQVVKIETQLGKSINYSFSPRFGFVTSNPAQCGTGFILTAYLHLSALIHTHKFQEVIDNIVNDRIEITSIQGNPDEYVGDIIALKNNYSLGVTEENIISNLRLIVTKLIAEENNVRNELKHSDAPEVKDKVSRAYAVLIHSYQIHAAEALNALSLVKLGVDLNWIEGVTIEALNELLFNCRRAHLLSRFNEEVPQDQIPHKRAEFIHATLKNAVLKVG